MKLTLPFFILAPIFTLAGFGCGALIWIEVLLK
jgi:hypothetical protein